MKQNLRFSLILVLVLAAVAAVWWLLSRQGAEAPSGPEVTRGETEEQSRAPLPPAPRVKPDETPQRLDRSAVGTRVSVDAPTAVRRTSGGGILTGLVLDEALKPAPGVKVVMSRTASEQGDAVIEEPSTAATGADGTFAAEGLAYGVYSLLATSGNTAAAQSAQVRSYFPDMALMLRLRPAYNLGGRVVDPQGAPTAEAHVTVMYVPTESMMGRWGISGSPQDRAQALPLESVTDAQGAFAFESVPAKEVFVAVKAEGYAPHISELIKLPVTGAVITLAAGGSVAGRVLQTDTGEPLSGFALRVSGPTSLDKHETTTNESGEFVCASLRPGEYALMPADDTWANAESAPRIKLASGEARQGIDLRVAQSGTIRGRVYNEQTGNGIPGAAVILRKNLMGYGNSVSTDNNGAYEMRGVPPGEHALAVQMNDRLASNPYGDQEAAVLSVKAGAVLEGVDLAVYMGTTVSGRVEYADGSPGGSATVFVIPVAGYGRARVMADTNGSFVFSGPANGEQLRLQAFKGTQASAPTEALQVPATGTLEDIVLTLQEGGVIAGVVTNRSGAPLPAMNVLVGGTANQLQPNFASADDTGSFLVAGLPPGTYTVTAMTQGEQGSGDATTTIDLAAGQRVSDVVLIWEKEAPAVGPKGNLTISGRVLDSAGKPLSDAIVYGTLNERNMPYTSKSLVDGSFTLSGLAAGAYKLSAIAGGNRTTEPVDAQAGASGIRLTVATQGKVSGRVLDAATGKPVTRFGVAFVTPGYLEKPSAQYVYWQRYTSPEGEFSAAIREQRHQQSGNLALAVRADGYSPVEQVLGALSQGQNVEGLLIRMKPGARVEGVVQTSSGQTVAGASIYLERYDPYRSPETRTNSEGQFVLTNLPLSAIKLVAGHPAYSNGEVSVTPRAGTTSHVTIELPAGGSVEGIVRMGNQPRAGTSVYLYMFEGGNQQSSTVTDASGHYVFSNVTSGRGQVSTYVQSSRGNLNQSRQVIVETGRTTTADFDLPAETGGLEGVVTIGGQPVTNAHVSAYLSSEEGSTSSYAQTNSDGSYVINSVPAGEVRVSVYIRDSSGGGGRQHSETAQIVAGSVTRLDFDLPLPTFVSGYLSGLKEGEMGYIGLLPGEIKLGPLTKEKVQEYLGMLAGQAEMNPDGTFRIENVEPGTYTVVGVAADPNAATPEDAIMNARIVTEVIEVNEGEEITVQLSID